MNARVILEKIRPLEDKLKYQIDKYVKASLTGQTDGADKSSYRANLKDLDVSYHNALCDHSICPLVHSCL